VCVAMVGNYRVVKWAVKWADPCLPACLPLAYRHLHRLLIPPVLPPCSGHQPSGLNVQLASSIHAPGRIFSFFLTAPLYCRPAPLP
jgi:hypothetical protein